MLTEKTSLVLSAVKVLIIDCWLMGGVLHSFLPQSFFIFASSIWLDSTNRGSFVTLFPNCLVVCLRISECHFQMSCAAIIFSLFVSSFGIKLLETLVKSFDCHFSQTYIDSLCLLHSTRTENTEIRNLAAIKLH